MSQPAWGLYQGDKLVASIRAANIYKARDLFKQHGLQGDRVSKIKAPGGQKSEGAA
jgi:hypothetical protein